MQAKKTLILEQKRGLTGENRLNEDALDSGRFRIFWELLLLSSGHSWMSFVFLNPQLRAKILALCLQPVIQRMAGLPTTQLEQVISPRANTIKRGRTRYCLRRLPGKPAVKSWHLCLLRPGI